MTPARSLDLCNGAAENIQANQAFEEMLYRIYLARL
jgi:hypothetical protein